MDYIELVCLDEIFTVIVEIQRGCLFLISENLVLLKKIHQRVEEDNAMEIVVYLLVCNLK